MRGSHLVVFLSLLEFEHWSPMVKCLIFLLSRALHTSSIIWNKQEYRCSSCSEVAACELETMMGFKATSQLCLTARGLALVALCQNRRLIQWVLIEQSLQVMFYPFYSLPCLIQRNLPSTDSTSKKIQFSTKPARNTITQLESCPQRCML